MKVFGETIAFKKNLQFSFRRYLVWWIILLVTMGFDIFTTAAFVSKYGVGAEANLTTRFLMISLSPFWGNVLGKVLQLFSVMVIVSLHSRFGNFFLLFIILVNCWAVVVNSMSLLAPALP